MWRSGEIVGQLHLGRFVDPAIGYINMFYVSPAWRGTGVASAMEDYACAYLQARGFQSAYLSVAAQNHRAIRFYEEQGWTDLGPRQDKPGTHNMEKRFTQPLNELNLPPDLRDFLQAEKQLQYAEEECEAGEVSLHALSGLRLVNLHVNTYATPLEEADPHQGESGYLVPAVSLTASCKGYDPDFLLLWLPTEDLYGNFDTEHGHLNVFPEVTWTGIVENPVTYLNSQWEPEDGLSVAFQPWPKYNFDDDEHLKLVNPVDEAAII